MGEIIVNCESITEPQQLHRALAEALNFPDWYGMNLDALYDCLTDITGETNLVLVDWDMLGGWSEHFADVFQDAAADNPDFTVTME